MPLNQLKILKNLLFWEDWQSMDQLLRLWKQKKEWTPSVYCGMQLMQINATNIGFLNTMTTMLFWTSTVVKHLQKAWIDIDYAGGLNGSKRLPPIKRECWLIKRTLIYFTPFTEIVLAKK